MIWSNIFPKETELIIAGGATGIDTLAKKYADMHKISKLILRPKYNLYGKSAPLKRNEEIIAIAEKILVIWGGKSRGTKYTIDCAKKKENDVLVITT